MVCDGSRNKVSCMSILTSSVTKICNLSYTGCTYLWFCKGKRAAILTANLAYLAPLAFCLRNCNFAQHNRKEQVLSVSKDLTQVA
jgi:hypothetical protein